MQGTGQHNAPNRGLPHFGALLLTSLAIDADPLPSRLYCRLRNLTESTLAGSRAIPPVGNLTPPRRSDTSNLISQFLHVNSDCKVSANGRPIARVARAYHNPRRQHRQREFAVFFTLEPLRIRASSVSIIGPKGSSRNPIVNIPAHALGLGAEDITVTRLSGNPR